MHNYEYRTWVIIRELSQAAMSHISLTSISESKNSVAVSKSGKFDQLPLRIMYCWYTFDGSKISLRFLKNEEHYLVVED